MGADWARNGLNIRTEACIFGGDDYAASVGATRTSASAELLMARQSVVAHCRAFGLQPIDIVQAWPLPNLALHDPLDLPNGLC